jgi:Fe2+ or Zn2+ uptake regulation protein
MSAWTARDEAAFQKMLRQRGEVMTKRRTELVDALQEAVMDRVQAEVLADLLPSNAARICDALAEYRTDLPGTGQ